MSSNIHEGKIRLSHSAFDLFHTCERQFQLERLLEGASPKEDYPATVLGKSFGMGVATYLITQDPERAIYEAWKAYFPILEDEKRTETVSLNLLMNSFSSLDSLLEDYEVAFFNGKPSSELSFCLDIDDKFYFVGYIDLVLKNKYTGKYAILEIKTTAMNLHSLDALYQNSGQALGYSIILDTIAGEEKADYEVIYFVGQLGSGNGYTPKIHVLPYSKNLVDRFNWFLTVKMDVSRLEQMLSLNVFPMRGHNCLQYMRPCKHLGTCQLHGLDSYLPALVDEVEYDFTFNLTEVIQNHLERINK